MEFEDTVRLVSSFPVSAFALSPPDISLLQTKATGALAAGLQLVTLDTAPSDQAILVPVASVQLVAGGAPTSSLLVGNAPTAASVSVTNTVTAVAARTAYTIAFGGGNIVVPPGLLLQLSITPALNDNVSIDWVRLLVPWGIIR